MKCKLAPISAFGKIVTGKTPDTKNKSYIGDKYLFITPNELHDGFMIDSTERKLSVEGLESIVNNTVNQGIHILVGCIGWDMGNVGIVEGKCAFNQQINAITDISDDYNPYYIYYLLSGKKELFRKVAGVTRTPILNKSSFENIEVPVLEKWEQDKIAWLLTSVDKKISINKKQINTLESMAKTLYEYWFVQFDFPDVNGKPYKTGGGKMEWNETLSREIPAGWEVKRLFDFVELKTDSNNPQESPKSVFEHYSIPAFDKEQFPVMEKGEQINSSKYCVTKEDILYSKLNPSFKRIWSPFAFTAKAVCSTEFLVFRVKNMKDYSFIYSVMNDDAFQSYMVQQSSSSTGSRKRVQPSNCMNYSFAVANDELCDKYSRVYHPIFEKRKRMIIENEKLASLRDFLLPMLMNGQVTFRQ